VSGASRQHFHRDSPSASYLGSFRPDRSRVRISLQCDLKWASSFCTVSRESSAFHEFGALGDRVDFLLDSRQVSQSGPSACIAVTRRDSASPGFGEAEEPGGRSAETCPGKSRRKSTRIPEGPNSGMRSFPGRRCRRLDAHFKSHWKTEYELVDLSGREKIQIRSALENPREMPDPRSAPRGFVSTKKHRNHRERR